MSDTPQTPATEPAAPAATPTEPTGAPPAAPSGQDAPRTFTQAELDQHIAARLERQRAALKAQQDKAAEEARAATLKEQGEFRALYEAEQARAAELASKLAAQERAQLLRKAARAAGLDPDDEDLVGRLRGESEDELIADAQKLAARLAPPTAPNLNGGGPARPPADPKAREEDIRRRFRIS